MTRISTGKREKGKRSYKGSKIGNARRMDGVGSKRKFQVRIADVSQSRLFGLLKSWNTWIQSDWRFLISPCVINLFISHELESQDRQTDRQTDKGYITTHERGQDPWNVRWLSKAKKTNFPPFSDYRHLPVLCMHACKPCMAICQTY